MAKVTTADFPLYSFEMFGRTAGDFAAFLTGVITEQAKLLEGRVGAAVYADASSPLAERIKQAEKLLVERELLRHRIVRLVGQVVGGDQFNSTPLEKQRSELKLEADALITQIVAGATVDRGGFSSSVSESGSAHGFPALPARPLC